MLVIDEGIELTPYKCTANKWTIGVGRNLSDKGLTLDEVMYITGALSDRQVRVTVDTRIGNPIVCAHVNNDIFIEQITEDQAMYLLHNDTVDACADLREVLGSHILPIEINNPRHMALISMMFNLGRGRFRGFRKMILAIENGDWEEAAEQAKDSNWYDQVGHRSKRIVHMLRTGDLHPDYSMT